MELIKGKESLTVENSEYFYFWLRDHCRCQLCYNHRTFQRKVNVTDIPIDVKPKEADVKGEELRVVWEDGHESTYSIPELEKLQYKNYLQRQERNYILWTKNEIQTLPVCHVDYNELLTTEEGVRKVIKSLIDYGAGFLENVPADIKSTEKAILRLSHVQHTLFGGMWQFSDSMDHSDTAYTAEELGAHTDNTYFTEAAGTHNLGCMIGQENSMSRKFDVPLLPPTEIFSHCPPDFPATNKFHWLKGIVRQGYRRQLLQVLHCISHSGTGGDSLLVDGFKALEILQKTDPDAFARLSTVCIEAEYLEPGYNHTYCAPIIKLNPVTKQPEQIRFNIHDRAAVCLPKDQILQHYKDYRLLGSIIKNPELEWRFKLNPGTVMIFDNFRVLHGRSSYTGHRTMCGCYIGRGDFLSKARVLNII